MIKLHKKYINMLHFYITLFITHPVFTNGIIHDEGLITSRYRGDSFPVKYLEENSERSSAKDLVLYINTLNRTLKYFLRMPNETDASTAICMYMTKLILKRVNVQHGNRLDEKFEEIIKGFVKKTDYILSHFIYFNKNLKRKHKLYKVSQLLRDETAAHTLSTKFNKDRLKPWIFSKNHVHYYVQQMDEATLDRNKYAELSFNYNKYYPNQVQSDHCLARIYQTAEPVTVSGTLQRCRPDHYCERLLHRSPSIAYTLSHRLFNLVLRRLIRNCYIKSNDKDILLMDMLCSFMYREAVYIARRGFFARDLFTEHIVMCSLLDYEEFHRRAWFRKIASWVDNRGCMHENINFRLNLTKLALSQVEEHDLYKERADYFRAIYHQDCEHHPMMLAMTAMAGAIRHTLNYMMPDEPTNTSYK